MWSRAGAAFSILVTLAVFPVATFAQGGIPDFCNSSVSIGSGPYCWVVCPEGDGPPLNALAPAPGDATISLTIRDAANTPIPNIPGSDFWLIGASNGLSLCGGASSINATGPTNAIGQTTIAGSMAAGGCDEGIMVVVQGIILWDAGCVDPVVLDIPTRSPDGNGDLVVNSVDFNQFGNAWTLLGGTYDACMDFDCNGLINSIDFNAFGNHWFHECF